MQIGGPMLGRLPPSISEQSVRAKAQKTKHLSKNTIKQLTKMHEMQAPALKYSTFVQMNKLWLQYITMVLCVRANERENGVDVHDGQNQTSICSKLVKADFSGAHVKVVKSKNEALVGVRGLVVRESARTFILIQPDDTVKVIPKEATVFQFRLPGHLKSSGEGKKKLAVNVWGDSILYKGSERSKEKFKAKFNLALF